MARKGNGGWWMLGIVRPRAGYDGPDGEDVEAEGRLPTRRPSWNPKRW